MKRSTLDLLGWGAALSALMYGSVAHACSGSFCPEAGFVGASEDETASPPIPANAPALRFALEGGLDRFDLPDAFAVTLSQMGAQASTSLSATTRSGADFIDLLFGTALTVGDTLIASGALTSTGESDAGAHSCSLPANGSWTVIPAAPLPKTLGTLSVTTSKGKVRAAGGAGCSELVEASQAQVQVELAEEAQPWAGVLAYETWVDGKRWNPSVSLVLGADSMTSSTEFIPGGALLTQARGSDVIYSLCQDEDSVEEARLLESGVHEVEIRAVVPGTEDVLIAGPVTVNLASCDEPSDIVFPAADAGSDEAGRAPTSPASEAGGEPTSSEPAANSSTNTSASSDSGGCSASTQGALHGGALSLWLLLLATAGLCTRIGRRR